ncbi:NADPH-dependent 2,4-dienoyl-CoA reductase/sulfur reductase-like enzyme [Variovorax boronicumulans]|uniref:NAD(P)/FAD-dependent oxidoreductase n=1 Tax=Variovorax boronicumulans TaxID=436515 RepID=UPI00278381ED|nr:FAD/NAD(P)-binding oxidoreductase [Variovorax boronicumulans]MDP9993101.1 NADPH-dependent 2,4-dienoyl-CoA reductase/sulfur reductase-like enzyme [Variovorax boronicumulans]MDQ0004451.1 NADPH-dependent 2,4-dienoyl-CoA reductase/sulfur reductase-like enzyme [Variovorax boronicumulans]
MTALEHCDVLIVGAGPAGMAAAVAAAPSGASIVVIDDNPVPGGQIWRDGPGASLPTAARKWRDALARHANIRVCSGTRVIAAPARNELLLEDAERGWRVQWKKLILCTGARELLLPFPGWTLPGVTGAGGLQALIKAGLPVEGERIVIAGSGPLLLAAAATARAAGAKVVRIAEQATFSAVAGFAANLWRWPGKAAQSVTLADPQYRTSSRIVSAQGNAQVESAWLLQGGREVEIACDRVACGFGLTPNTQLGQLLGCTLTVEGAQALAVDARQLTSLPNVYAAGECTGFGGSERALAQGSIAGYYAVGDERAAKQHEAERARWDVFAAQLHRSFALAPEIKQMPQPDTLVCRCEDVPFSALADCTGWTDAKLHRRCGMGACQGRVCGDAAQFLFGWTPPAPRPPLSPVRIATLAGLANEDDARQ